MADNPSPLTGVVEFLRKRDFRLVKELGQGACGKTVLLYDEQIDEHFVCKKYTPYSEEHRQELYASFVREIKLLHQVHHPNVVRVFNYYLYPEAFAGFIVMEYIGGSDIDDYLRRTPEQINEVFLQAIDGFAYLERAGILHRDIRPGNLMVTTDGIVKIIDLGFGKHVATTKDFEKSISLNWWCETPAEFALSTYTFQTEVYFLGRLFERIIQSHSINHFKYMDALRRMCQGEPSNRSASFSEVEQQVRSNQFFEIEFTEEERDWYRAFSVAVCQQITKIENGAKYVTDISRIQTQLSDAYRALMLERVVPDSSVIIRCLLFGNYYYRGKGNLPVDAVRDFVRLLKTSTEEKCRIILANLHTRFDALPRYAPATEQDDEIPF